MTSPRRRMSLYTLVVILLAATNVVALTAMISQDLPLLEMVSWHFFNLLRTCAGKNGGLVTRACNTYATISIGVLWAEVHVLLSMMLMLVLFGISILCTTRRSNHSHQLVGYAKLFLFLAVVVAVAILMWWVVVREFHLYMPRNE